MPEGSQIDNVLPANTGTPLKGDFERMARRRYQRGTVFLKERKCGAVWVGQWRESVIEPDGSEHRVLRKEILGTKKDLPTKRLAERELELKLAPVNHYSYRGLRQANFQMFAAVWKENVLPNYRISFQPSIVSQIDKWLIPHFGKVSVREINGQMIQSFIQNLELAPKSKKNLLSTMRSMWRSALAWGYAQHDPFDAVVLPEWNQTERPYFTEEQIRQIIALAKQPYSTAFWLVAETGIRRGELCGLNVGHVDLANSIITVKQSCFQKQITPTKSRRPRVFSLSRQLARALEPFVTGRDADAPLFLTRRGERLYPEGVVKRHLKPILRKLGIKGGMHAFRHANATMLDRINAPIKLRQERLGHVNASTTMGYTHLVGEDDRKLSQQLGEILMPNDAQQHALTALVTMEVKGVQ